MATSETLIRDGSNSTEVGEEAVFGVGTRSWQSRHETCFVPLTLTLPQLCREGRGRGQGQGAQHEQPSQNAARPSSRLLLTGHTDRSDQGEATVYKAMSWMWFLKQMVIKGSRCHV